MGGRVGGPVVIFDAMMRKVLSGGHIGHGEDVRSCDCSVVVLGSSCKHSPSLDLVIATCRVFRHISGHWKKPMIPALNWPLPILNKRLES